MSYKPPGDRWVEKNFPLHACNGIFGKGRTYPASSVPLSTSFPGLFLHNLGYSRRISAKSRFFGVPHPHEANQNPGMSGTHTIKRDKHPGIFYAGGRAYAMKVHPLPLFAQMPPELDNVTRAVPLTWQHRSAGVGDSTVSNTDTFRRGRLIICVLPCVHLCILRFFPGRCRWISRQKSRFPSRRWTI